MTINDREIRMCIEMLRLQNRNIRKKFINNEVKINVLRNLILNKK